MADNERQNVLFILTDQHRKGSLGCYGNTVCHTPNLNRLAREGVVFDNAYTTCPVCSPARASLQTGQYPFHHGMQTNIFDHGCMVHELPDTQRLLSRSLQRAGVQAGYTGKWHLGFGRDAFRDPYYQQHYRNIDTHIYDIVYPEFYRDGSSLPSELGYVGDDFPGHGGGGHNYPQYLEYLKANGLEHKLKPGEGGADIVSPVESTMPYYLTQRCKTVLDDFRQQASPFFFMLNFWGPHGPAYVHRTYMERYREATFEPWPSFDEDQRNKPRIHNAKRARVEWKHIENQLRYYYGYVSFIDAQIGRLLEYLREHDLDRNTWIIFSADHGDSMGIHNGLMDKSFYLYEDTASVPLIIRPPGGLDEGRREDRFASHTDLYSTILDIAGLPEEQCRRDGRSLLPLIRNETVHDWPRVAVTEASGLAFCLFTQRMIRRGTHKYVFNCGDIDELYDLQNDPCEMRNLAVETEYGGLLREMREELAAWMEEHDDRLLGQFKSICRMT